MAADPPQSVLFACSMNVIRSPMAEAIMKHLYGRRVYVDSAGSRRGETDPFVAAVLDEFGIDASRHRPKTFDDLQDFSYDLVVTLAPDAQHRALELTRYAACEVEYWPTIDPTFVTGNRDARLAAFRDVREAVAAAISRRFPQAPR